MGSKGYTPSPIDTSSVELPSDIKELVELLAKNVHENWALERMKEGWAYGPKRDGELKSHPSMVPYEDLEEAEKDYDRRSAVETLRVILASGFQIIPAARDHRGR
jgi:hypothetical protein